jgi:uncharacterized protein (DUF1697 family)
MADFKALLLELGCDSATTLLNSGNAVVKAPKSSSKALAAKVARSIAAKFGFDVAVVVKTAAELDHIVKENQLALMEDEHSRLLVAFAQDKEAIAALHPLSSLVVHPEELVVQEQAAYLYCARGILESKAAEALLGRLGRSVTTRNWATVLKLNAFAQSAA